MAQKCNIDDNLVLDLVSKGFGITYIAQCLHIGLKPIQRICKTHGVYDVLKYNGRQNSIQVGKNRIIKFRNNKYAELNEKYGEILKQLILNENCNLADLLRKLPIKKYDILLFLSRNAELLKKYKENTKLRRKETSIECGKLAANTLTGVYLKPLTEEIKNRFIQLKKEGKFREQVRRIIEKEFGYGEKKYYQLCKLLGYPDENPQTGIYAAAYGKSPSKNCGNGIKSRLILNGYNIFCRSLLELKVYLYLINNNIPFTQSKHRIPYLYENKTHTYNPDIVINEMIYEIKPENLVTDNINIHKQAALIEYCKQYNLKNGGYIIETTYNLTTYRDISYIDKLIANGNLVITDKELIRLRKNYERKYRNEDNSRGN